MKKNNTIRAIMFALVVSFGISTGMNAASQQISSGWQKMLADAYSNFLLAVERARELGEFKARAAIATAVAGLLAAVVASQRSRLQSQQQVVLTASQHPTSSVEAIISQIKRDSTRTRLTAKRIEEIRQYPVMNTVANRRAFAKFLLDEGPNYFASEQVYDPPVRVSHGMVAVPRAVQVQHEQYFVNKAAKAAMEQFIQEFPELKPTQ